jgi:hypothetical protein
VAVRCQTGKDAWGVAAIAAELCVAGASDGSARPHARRNYEIVSRAVRNSLSEHSPEGREKREFQPRKARQCHPTRLWVRPAETCARSRPPRKPLNSRSLPVILVVGSFMYVSRFQTSRPI